MADTNSELNHKFHDIEISSSNVVWAGSEFFTKRLFDVLSNTKQKVGIYKRHNRLNPFKLVGLGVGTAISPITAAFDTVKHNAIWRLSAHKNNKPKLNIKKAIAEQRQKNAETKKDIHIANHNRINAELDEKKADRQLRLKQLEADIAKFDIKDSEEKYKKAAEKYRQTKYDLNGQEDKRIMEDRIERKNTDWENIKSDPNSRASHRTSEERGTGAYFEIQKSKKDLLKKLQDENEKLKTENKNLKNKLKKDVKVEKEKNETPKTEDLDKEINNIEQENEKLREENAKLKGEYEETVKKDLENKKKEQEAKKAEQQAKDKAEIDDLKAKLNDETIKTQEAEWKLWTDDKDKAEEEAKKKHEKEKAKLESQIKKQKERQNTVFIENFINSLGFTISMETKRNLENLKDIDNEKELKDRWNFMIKPENALRYEIEIKFVEELRKKIQDNWDNKVVSDNKVEEAEYTVVENEAEDFDKKKD